MRSIPDNPYKAECSVCNIIINADKTSLLRHKTRIKHQKALKKQTLTSHKIDSFLSNTETKSDIQAKEAEIALCAFIAEHNLPYKIMEHLPSLLKNIFSDSSIVKKINLGRTKTRGVITNVIGEFHKEKLGGLLKKTKFSVLIDESTDIGTVKQTCIVVRCYSGENIDSYLWELVPMTEEGKSFDGSAENIFNTVWNTFAKRNIPADNIIGFASDGCNLMMGSHNSVASRFKQRCPGITILKCICHSLHLCSSEACKSLPRCIEDLARDVYSFFKVSPLLWQF